MPEKIPAKILMADSPGYGPAELPFVGGGGGGPLDALFASGEDGDYWNIHDFTRLYTDVSKSTVLTGVPGQPIGAAVGYRGVYDLLQPGPGIKPTYNNAGSGNNGAYSIDRYTLRRLTATIPGFGTGDFTVIGYFEGSRTVFDYSSTQVVEKDASNWLSARHGISQDGEQAVSTVAGSVTTSGKAFSYSSLYKSSVVLWRDKSTDTYGIRGRASLGAYLGAQSNSAVQTDYGDEIHFMARPTGGQGIHTTFIGGFVINRLCTTEEETLVMDTLEGFVA